MSRYDFDYAGESWLTSSMYIDDRLRRALHQLPPDPQRVRVLDTLAEELGFDASGWTVDDADLYSMLHDMLPTLEEAIVAGDFFREWPPKVADAAVHGLSLHGAVVVMLRLGWGSTQINRSRIRDLESDVKDRLAELLVSRVSKMFGRWEKQQYFKRIG